MAAAGHASSVNSSFYDQPSYIGASSSAPLVNNGRESGFYKSGQVNHDDPPFSRVFVVCSRSHTTEALQAAFEKYGQLEDVWIVRDKFTKESRGVAYIKFSKMSEATLAVEKLDGKPLDDDTKPIKALIAKPKSSKSTEDFEDATALTRLFIVIPKKMEESELRSVFDQFGEVDYVQVVKDRKTRESKGFGYVNFKKPYYAALALEGCDRSFRAVMAEPKSAKLKRESMSEAGSVTYISYPSGPQHDHPLSSSTHDSYAPPAFAMSLGFPDTRSAGGVCNRLQVMVHMSITQDQLAHLFDLIPGMELCDLKKNFQTGESKGIACVVYNSVGSAVYAKEKLNGFEYPPGSKLLVRYAPDDEGFAFPVAAAAAEYGGTPTVPPVVADVSSAKFMGKILPTPKPLADSKSEVAERLFIVCTPSSPGDKALKDVFSRFGDLIDVYMLKNKNFGYAKFATKAAAKTAMDALHGEELLGVRLKVMPADPPRSQDPARKRPRT